ncbi:GNAT family N-acetyltransferase [Bradyrhizobium aeschynomenes]|uniref:GNAT family N-acetyltransferase n=1 Tax=Bradyrhizobium aeschynomenes TaxID=2734909 RepID=UPI001552092D|nr:GNAT family N-acetyltransferase [Bradyrhizobium aeschynomenes]NPV23968.1 GNAT family N-acetyltransferase [Bradyrhizobium aeschynomenes]
MLQDITTPTLRKARPCVLETPRLTLRPPLLSDISAIARLANDRRIAENTRRLPHPYSEVDAARFVRALEHSGETAFVIEHLDAPIGMVGINRPANGRAELGYWLGVDHWGRGFGTEAARAAIDDFFETSEENVLIGHARVSNPASRNILEKCGFQWTGVELHRFEVLGSSAPVDAFRLTRGVWASLKAWANAGRRS